tara:strand:- start:1413 stop:1967 length:555 start_codon:yes stop_codon:yes gene_type:complete
MDNLKLWNSVCKTDPKHTKPAKIGGMSITAIAPQYQVMNATKEFGPYGVKWGFKDIDLDYSLIEKYDIIVFKGTFFCPEGESKIINSAKMHMDRAKKMVDADFAKKIETDSLTKALSKLGFNADVFMGRFDDVKYVADMNIEFAEPLPLTDTDNGWINAIKAGTSQLEQIDDLTYREFIKGNLK